MESALSKIKSIVEKNKANAEKYWIPERWNFIEYKEFSRCSERQGEICVNPADFYCACIDRIEEKQDMPTWESKLTHHAMYSMLIRCESAWDHDKKDEIQSGSFLKSICLLPHIRALGADIIYILPIFKHSNRYKKGSLGSPYSVRNFYALDDEQFDSILGDFDPEILDLSFAAFVEACHKLGMKVMLDFVFRTAARDNILIREHPDWFYWIDMNKQDEFRPIKVDSLPKLAPPKGENIKLLYESTDLNNYLSYFDFDPIKKDKKAFNEIMKSCNESDDYLSEIEQSFSITTAPACSDVINDPQPLWTDVTYLRLDLDRSEAAAKKIPKDSAPAILNDGMKMSETAPGKINEDLCKYLIGIIPHYQQRYGIDGARIDMGHALPKNLQTDILDAARKINPDFLLWSEVFQAAYSAEAAANGYDMISGSTWDNYAKKDQPDFDNKYLKDIFSAALPPLAAIETADTPRAIVTHENFSEYKDLIVFNSLLPASIPMINGGMEIAELEPMNLGLGESEGWQELLDKNDPMRGKLAFFDTYRLHWTQNDKGIRAQIADAMALRCECIDLLEDSEALQSPLEKKSLATELFLEKDGRSMLIYWRRNDEAEKYLHKTKAMHIRYSSAFTKDGMIRENESLDSRLIVLTSWR